MLKGPDTIFRRVFFVSQNRKTLQGNPFVVCFRKLPVAKKFMDKRGVSVPKNFLGEPFSVSLLSGIEKFYASEG